MKRKIIVLILILAVVSLVIFNHKKIYNLYQMKKLENEYKNFLGYKFQNNVDPYLVKEYNRLNQDVEMFNHNDITELIDSYIDMLEKSCELYKKEKVGEDVIFADPPKFKNYMESEMGKDIIMRNDAWLQTFYDITDEDIVNYDNGTFIDLLVNELKKCLEYEEIDDKIKWEINSTEEKTIELPYNCYLVYTPYKRVKQNECKQVIDIIIKNPKEFDNSKPGFSFTIKYEDLGGNIKYVDGAMTKHKIDGREYHSYDTVFWDTEVIPRATLKSHTGDRREDEAIAEAQRLHDEEEERFNSENYKWVDPYVVGEQQIKLREAIFGK